MKENSDWTGAGGRSAWPDMMLPEARAEQIASLEADFDKIKQCYPPQVTNIRYMVEDTCDRLEYEGSPMFDEIPDAATVYQLAQDIYRQVAADQDEDMIPCIAWPVTEKKDDCRDGRCRDCRSGGCVPPYVPDCESGNCMLRQMIEIMLLNEMSHRRNRYRTRRW